MSFLMNFKSYLLCKLFLNRCTSCTCLANYDKCLAKYGNMSGHVLHMSGKVWQMSGQSGKVLQHVAKSDKCLADVVWQRLANV